MITYRKAAAGDIRPAFELALRVFMEYEAPACGPEALERFRRDMARSLSQPEVSVTGRGLMIVSLDGERVVGMVEAGEDGHVRHIYIDGAYRCRGMATMLMNHVVNEFKHRGFDKITLDASPYGLPFYMNYGFTAAGDEENTDGFVTVPMVYEFPGKR